MEGAMADEKIREEGKKKPLDRGNMARSHGYFSFTLLCICAGMRKVPEPQGSLAASGSSPIPQTCHSPLFFPAGSARAPLGRRLLVAVVTFPSVTANT